MSSIPSREEALFTDALAQPPAERAAFLAEACGDNVGLLARIAALIAAHEGESSVLTSPTTVFPAGALREETVGDYIAHYKLLQKLGEGGCGVVWMAEQEEPVRRRVALKIIKLGMDTKAVVARFEAERQALAMMDHPNIAKVHDAGATDTGRPFFVMELVRGIPITKYCDESHLTPTARLELFIEVCQAVQHAHQKGIIHRDLKPSNILVTVNDGAPTPKVIDFGIAKATQGRLTDATVFTQFEQFIGTPVYMSPEQAEMSSLDIDTRSDIYSLGVLLYELLTGKPPFDPKAFAQAGVDQVRKQIREVEPPRPSARLHSFTDEEQTTIARLRGTATSQLAIILRGDLDWIVMRCIEKDRTRRYDTANGLAMDIQRYLRNEPVVARPPTTAYLLQKLVHRHKLAFAAAAAVVTALFVGLTLAGIAFLREKEAREEARKAENIAAAGRAGAEEFFTFVLTDFSDRLTEFGHRPLLGQLAGKAVAYYESLPAAMRTRETKTSLAFALATQGDENVNRARQLMSEVESSGPLTPFMRVVAGVVLTKHSSHLWNARRHLDGIPVCERAERLLADAVADPKWGGWAQQGLVLILHRKGRHLQEMPGRVTEAVAVFEQSILHAHQAEQHLSSEPDLLAARVMVDACRALFYANRRSEAREMAAVAAQRWREVAARDPMRFGARLNLARALRRMAEFAMATWSPDVPAINAELQQIYEDLMKHDPSPVAHRHSLASSWFHTAFFYHRLRGEFAEAETALKKAVELLEVANATPLDRRTLQWVYLHWAALCAAKFSDGDVDRHIAAARAVHQRNLARLDGETREIESEEFEEVLRQAEFERLGWAAVRASAERSVERLTQLQIKPELEGTRAILVTRAQRDVTRAALEAGDNMTARRQLDRWNPPRELLSTAADPQQRWNRLNQLLTRIMVVARSEDRHAAALELSRIWSEVEAVFALGTEQSFNRVQLAWALSLRAELHGTLEQKRAWLKSAADQMRPLASAGKLTRYEREVLFAEIERQFAALPKTEPP